MENSRKNSPSNHPAADDWDNDEDSSTSFNLIQTTVQVELSPVETHSSVLSITRTEEILNNNSAVNLLLLPPTSPAISTRSELITTKDRKDEEEEKKGQDKMECRGRVASLKTGALRQSQQAKLLRNAFSLETKLDATSDNGEDVRERLKSLISEFSRRAERKKDKIIRPVTPSSAELSSDPDGEDKAEKQLRERMDELFPTSTESSITNVFALSGTAASSEGHCCTHQCFPRGRAVLQHCLALNFALDAQSYIYIGWLLLVTCCFLYNAWVIPLRLVFPCESPHNYFYWIAMDLLADFIYAMDTFVIKAHMKYIQDGFWVKEPQKIRAFYFRSFKFKLGLISIVPLDWIVLIMDKQVTWLRIPRLIKVGTFWELFRRFDSVLSSPHPLRIARSILHMLYLIHMYASAYYALSSWEREAGHKTDWMFVMEDKTVLQSYIRCFYFATKTATSIGKNPKPENEIEYLFMTCAWLSGVFAFAILIGQIRDVIATATRNQTEYRQLLYATVNYLRRFDVPKHLQERVTMWLTYTWQQQKTLDEGNILGLLPTKMQADIALHVHIQMLNTVKLFQNCEAAFLRDLVPRLKSIIFLPGDFVCRKGEVGREMYIVKSGRVDVIGGSPGNEKLLASLQAGSVFGEIALLQIDGMDKRTADVRSAGFSNLFVLRKKDIKEVIKDYPAAQESLKKQAKQLMKEKQKKERKKRTKQKQTPRSTKFITAAQKLLEKVSSSEESDGSDVIIKGSLSARSQYPKLIDTVLQAVPEDSKTAHYLQYGFKSITSPTHAIPDTSIASYPPSPYLPASSSGFGKIDINLETYSSIEDLVVESSL